MQIKPREDAALELGWATDGAGGVDGPDGRGVVSAKGEDAAAVTAAAAAARATAAGMAPLTAPINVVMEPGSVLLMAGAVQDHFYHRLPLHEDIHEDSHEEGESLNDTLHSTMSGAPERVSLTMRSIVRGYEDQHGLAPTGSCV